MKKLLLLFCLITISNNYSQTLSAGDIAFIGFNTDNTEGYSFITLTDIPASEKIFFSDRGIISSGAYILGTEGTYLFTAPSGGISCGTIVSFSETAPDTYTITGVSGATMVLQAGSANLGSGDQVYAYQTPTNTISSVPSDATFIAGIHSDYDSICVDGTTKWTQSVCVSSTSESIVPPGLTNGTNSLSLTPSGPEMDNFRYTGTLTGASAFLLSEINNFNNWESNNSPPYDISPSGYASPSVTCPPVLSVTNNDLEKINIYPNPSKDGEFFINKSNSIELKTARVFNVIGQTIKEVDLKNTHKISLNGENNGVYFIKIISTDNNSIIKSIIINQ